MIGSPPSLVALFVLLHAITAAAWFGLALRLGSQTRLVLSLDRPQAVAVAQDLGKTVRLIGIFISLTLVFGLVTFFVGGGFGVYPPQYHSSLGLIFIAAVVHYAMVQPAWKTIQQAVRSDHDSEPQEATSARKRIGMGVGINHLIWLVLIVLMFWKYFMVAFL